MRLACLLACTLILAFAARAKLRDRMALKTADVFTRAYLAGWGDGLASAAGVVDECMAGLDIEAGHYDAQVRAAKEGRQ